MLKELLQINEAKEAGRAWAGRLKKIDELLSWMYEKDILSAAEKNEKDKVCRQYYRWYNDGDLPAAVRVQGIGKRNEKAVEEALEDFLEKFLKKILSKYLSKIDRTEFRYDNMIKSLKNAQDVAKRGDAYGLLTYWLKETKIKDDDGTLADLVADLKEYHDITREAVDKADPKQKNVVLSFARSQMKEAKTWTKECERSYIEMTETCSKIANFIGNIIAGLEKLKALRVLEKGE